MILPTNNDDDDDDDVDSGREREEETQLARMSISVRTRTCLTCEILFVGQGEQYILPSVTNARDKSSKHDLQNTCSLAFPLSLSRLPAYK